MIVLISSGAEDALEELRASAMNKKVYHLRIIA